MRCCLVASVGWLCYASLAAAASDARLPPLAALSGSEPDSDRLTFARQDRSALPAALVAAVACLLGSTAGAGPDGPGTCDLRAGQLIWPVRQEDDRPWWVVSHYTDMGGGKDYAGGRFTYPGHEGIDIVAAHGRDLRIVAVADARVTEVVDHYPNTRAARCCTNRLVLRLDSGLDVIYLHQSPDTATVNVGDRVAAGAELARPGRSGRARRASTHVEVRCNGRAISAMAKRLFADGPPYHRPLSFVDLRYSDKAIAFSPKGAFLQPNEIFGLPPVPQTINRGTRGFIITTDGALAGDRLDVQVRSQRGPLVNKAALKPTQSRQALWGINAALHKPGDYEVAVKINGRLVHRQPLRVR